MIGIAWTALVIWPLIAIILFRVCSLPVALSVTIVGGYLMLPSVVQVDLPVLPPIDKDTVPAVTALICTMVALSSRTVRAGDVLPGWVPRNGAALVLISLLVLGAFGTALTNGDGLAFGPRVLQGLAIYDALSLGLGILMMLLPFFLARKVLATPEAQLVFLKVLVVVALGYSLLALWEVRMSPQLNRQIYGFFPHSWIQHLRSGGFRPIVFLEHGLQLGIFLTCAFAAAIGLARIGGLAGTGRWAMSALWLFMTILVSKVFGALLIACALLPIVLMNVRVQLLAAAAIGVLVLTYPVLRVADVVPVDRAVTFAERFSAERAGSLQFRLDHEDMLLERARERPVFGWGGWGRNRVFDEFGRDLSTTDGSWIIIFGQGGWLRYIAEFGLLTLSLVFLAVRRRPVAPVFAVTALVLAANLIDLLPNSGVSPITWMLAGSIFGCLERRSEVPTQEDDTPETLTRPTYRRTFPDPASARSSPDPEALRSRYGLRRDFAGHGDPANKRV